MFGKGIINSSKFHEVTTQMKKVFSAGGGAVNLSSSFQKASAFTYKNPNIHAVKYGQEIEGHAAEKFD